MRNGVQGAVVWALKSASRAGLDTYSGFKVNMQNDQNTPTNRSSVLTTRAYSQVSRSTIPKNPKSHQHATVAITSSATATAHSLTTYVASTVLLWGSRSRLVAWPSQLSSTVADPSLTLSTAYKKDIVRHVVGLLVLLCIQSAAATSLVAL